MASMCLTMTSQLIVAALVFTPDSAVDSASMRVAASVWDGSYLHPPGHSHDVINSKRTSALIQEAAAGCSFEETRMRRGAGLPRCLLEHHLRPADRCALSWRTTLMLSLHS